MGPFGGRPNAAAACFEVTVNRISQHGPFAALRRFVRPETPVERCGLCGIALPSDHEHLSEPAARKLVCCCTACAILFSERQDGRYRRVQPRLQSLAVLDLKDRDLAGLGVPVGLVFFYRSSATGGVLAVYPSPAGPLESPVDAAAWDALTTISPVLRELEPDVEALLVNRVNGARDCFRCSIDRCYHLIGLVRARWQGFSGGPELWREVEEFFAGMRSHG